MDFAAKGLHTQPDDPLAVACIAVSFPLDLWERPSRWKSGPAPSQKLLLNALVPLSAVPTSDEQPDTWAHWRQQLRLVEEWRSQPAGQSAFRCD